MKNIFLSVCLFLSLASVSKAQLPAPPTIIPSAGPYQTNVTVAITEATPGYVIFYTTDGSTPTQSSTLYTGPFIVSANATVKAVAIMIPSTAVASSAFTITVPPPPCLTSVSTSTFTASTAPITPVGDFRITFDATPSTALMDGLVGLSKGPATAYTSMAAIVRFNDKGFIDAMNGASFYTSLTPVPYLAGTAYHFVLDINVKTKTYNVSVNGAPLGTANGFRPEAVATVSMDTVDTVSTIGTVKVCNIVTSAPIVALPHKTVLDWNISTTATGYNAYSSATAGGPYGKLNSTPLSAASFTDTTIKNGQRYYYVVTAVDALGQESAFSKEVSVQVPLLRKKNFRKATHDHRAEN